MDHNIFKEFDWCYELEIPNGSIGTIIYEKKEGTIISSSNVVIDTLSLLPLFKALDQKNIHLCGICTSDYQFIIYDIQMNWDWLNVKTAHALANYLKLPFVKYEALYCDMVDMSAVKDNVELRPIQECIDEDGNRIIYRKERKIGFIVDNEEKRKELEEAAKIKEIVDALPVNVTHIYEGPKEEKKDEI